MELDPNATADDWEPRAAIGTGGTYCCGNPNCCGSAPCCPDN
jgi:hypothetical protein